MKQNWYGLQSLHAVTLVCLMNNFHGYLAIPICSTFLAFFSHAEENIELELQAYFKCSTVINLSRRKSITLAQIAQVLARRCDFEMMLLQFLIIHFSTFNIYYIFWCADVDFWDKSLNKLFFQESPPSFMSDTKKVLLLLQSLYYYSRNKNS